MKKTALELNTGDKIQIADQICTITEKEVSDVGKHGKRKVRLVLQKPDSESLVIVRPADYPFTAL